MSIFEKITNLIRKSVGNNLENEEDDVRVIRETLDDVANEPDPNPETEEDGKPLGIITRALDTKIKDFQKDNDLRVDGLINPGGETEAALLQKTAEKKTPPLSKKKPDSASATNKDNDFYASLFKRVKEKEELYTPLTQDIIKTKKEEKVINSIMQEDGEVIEGIEEEVLDKTNKKREKQTILKNVDDKEIINFTKEEEGNIPYMYRDTKGNVTIGVGHLIPNLKIAKKLPLYLYKNNEPVRLATDEEITRAYKYINKIDYGQNIPATKFKPSTKNKIPNIGHKKKDINEFLRKDLIEKVDGLRENWPEFDQAPSGLKKAMLDIAFNTGSM